MTYVFDTSSFKELFHFYPKRFPSLWSELEKLIAEKTVLSVKEVLQEISGREDALKQWAVDHKKTFEEPTADEAGFLAEIFRVQHFQFSLERQKLLKGGAFADPFVIAKAKIKSGSVVTQECFKENGSKIPNICRHFNVKCLNLEGFMEQQNWSFELSSRG